MYFIHTDVKCTTTAFVPCLTMSWFAWQYKIVIGLLWSKCYLTANSFTFYELSNSYKFVQPHSLRFCTISVLGRFRGRLGVIIRMNPYEYTHIQYIFWKYVHVYTFILVYYIYIYFIYKHKMFHKCIHACVCIYIYIVKIYTVYTYIM